MHGRRTPTADRLFDFSRFLRSSGCPPLCRRAASVSRLWWGRRRMRLRWFSMPLFVGFMLFLCVALLAVNFFELNWIQYEHNKFHHGQEPYARPSPSPSSSQRNVETAKRPSYIVLAKHVRHFAPKYNNTPI